MVLFATACDTVTTRSVSLSAVRLNNVMIRHKARLVTAIVYAINSFVFPSRWGMSDVVLPSAVKRSRKRAGWSVEMLMMMVMEVGGTPGNTNGNRGG